MQKQKNIKLITNTTKIKKSLGQNKVLIRGIGILARTWNPEARCANLKIKLMCIFNAGIKSVSLKTVYSVWKINNRHGVNVQNIFIDTETKKDINYPKEVYAKHKTWRPAIFT